MEQNRTLFGIGFMLLFCTLAPLGDALAKSLAKPSPWDRSFSFASPYK